MESVGALPAPDDTLSPTITSLFGVLSTNEGSTTEEECHFCFENIVSDELFITKTSCCGHIILCKCFKTWAILSFHFSNGTGMMWLLQNNIPQQRILFPMSTEKDEQLISICFQIFL